MYVKLFSQILDSSIAENRNLRHFFTDLLLCADCEGRVMMTNQAIARRIGASLEEVEWGLLELQKPDPMSKTVDHDGRRIEPVEGHGYGWKVLNFEFYRSLKDPEQLRNETKERVRKFREIKRLVTCNTHVTQCNKSNDIEKQRDIEKQKDMICRAEEVLIYLNEKTGKKFQAVNGSLKFIEARISDGATVEQCRAVIDLKCLSWLKDSKMKDYLRPQTLFNAEKFAAYVGEIGSQAPVQNLKDEWDNFGDKK